MMNLVNPQMLMQMMLQHSILLNSKILPPTNYPTVNAARFSPLSSSSNSSSSFQSPIKLITSDQLYQIEPLNLCKRDINESQMNIARQKRINVSHQRKSRQFKCNQCQDIFNCLATLTDHTMTEHKGYRCHICMTPFTQRSNLQRHALRHIGVRPYACGVCFREYYRKDHLIRHITVNHPKVVNPKEHIIQRMSSSESLNFIDRQIVTKHEEEVKTNDSDSGVIIKAENMLDTSMDTEEFDDEDREEQEDCFHTEESSKQLEMRSSNVFLTTSLLETTEVDIMN